jgi:predicted glutamine amidotransferase
MFLQCSNESSQVDFPILKKFIATCHWQYLRKYNLFGHHSLGWGFAYIPEDSNNHLIIKRDIHPIYKADWKSLAEIKTRFLVVHARKTMPWKRSLENVHPINIGEKYLIVHNGIIKNPSFPKLSYPDLEKIRKETNLDTRKYLCYIIDKLKEGFNLQNALKEIFQVLELGAGANAFLFNAQECNVITYHNTNFNGRHHTLFIQKDKDTIFVSTTPLKLNSKELTNKILLNIDLNTLRVKSYNIG